MEQIVTCLWMVQKLTNSKQKILSPLCLGNISKGWSVDTMKKTGFSGYVYDVRVDILDIDIYLMKKIT